MSNVGHTETLYAIQKIFFNLKKVDSGGGERNLFLFIEGN